MEPGEVDVVVIAGMGGQEIIRILDWDMGKSKSFKKLIFQPRNNSGKLRFYLENRGFDIKEELIVPEKEKFSEILSAVPIKEKQGRVSYKMIMNSPWDYTQYDYPESLLSNKKEYLMGFLNDRLAEEKSIYEKIAHKIETEESQDLDRRVKAMEYRKRRVDYLNKLIEEAEKR